LRHTRRILIGRHLVLLLFGVRPLIKKMTLTGTAKPVVSPALASQIDNLKGNPDGAMLQLEMTIIGRL